MRAEGLPSDGQNEPREEAMCHPIPDEFGEPVSPLATKPVASQQRGHVTVATVPTADRNLSRDSNGHLETGPS